MIAASFTLSALMIAPTPLAVPASPNAASACASDAGGSHRLTVWHPLSDVAMTVLDEHVAAFGAAHPDIAVEVVKKPNYAELVNDLGSTPPELRPDVIIAAESSVLNLASSGLSVAPDRCGIPTRDLLPVIEATYSVDDELVAVPYNVSTPVLYFNEVLLERAGIDPSDPPTTLDELRMRSDEVQSSGVAAHGFVAYDGYGPWWVRQFAAQRGDVIAVPANGRPGPLEKLCLATPAIVADFEWLRDGVLDGSFHWLGGNASGFDDLVQLTTEQAGAAYGLHTSGSLGDIIGALDDGAFPESRLGAAPMPGGGGLVGGGALWLLDHHDEERLAASARLVEWLSGPSRIAELAAATGYIPTTPAAAADSSLQEAWEAHPELRVGYDQLTTVQASPATAGLLAVESREVDMVLNYRMHELIYGDRPVPDILAEVNAELSALMGLPPDEAGAISSSSASCPAG